MRRTIVMLVVILACTMALAAEREKIVQTTFGQLSLPVQSSVLLYAEGEESVLQRADGTESVLKYFAEPVIVGINPLPESVPGAVLVWGCLDNARDCADAAEAICKHHGGVKSHVYTRNVSCTVQCESGSGECVDIH